MNAEGGTVRSERFFPNTSSGHDLWLRVAKNTFAGSDYFGFYLYFHDEDRGGKFPRKGMMRGCCILAAACRARS